MPTGISTVNAAFSFDNTTPTTYNISLDDFSASSSPPPVTATPTFSPDGGPVITPTQDVIISCATSGATIRYTIDGSDPTEATETVINSGDNIAINQSTVLKAKAWSSGNAPSSIKSATYLFGTLGSANYFRNGDFELPVLPSSPGYLQYTTPTYWTGSCTLYKTEGVTGQAAAITPFGSGESYLLQGVYGVNSGQQYCLTFSSKVWGTAPLQVLIRESGTDTTLLHPTMSVSPTANGYVEYTLFWTGGSTGVDLVDFFFTGTTPYTYCIYLDNVSVRDVIPAYTSYSRPANIPGGTATVDGDLSDWVGADWVPLDQNYDLDPSADITEAYYAAKWTADKVYVAVKVKDTYNHFTNTYDQWDSRDAVEIYLHTTGTGPTNYNSTQADAQQYTVGITSDNNSAVWATVGGNNSIPTAANFQAAGRKGTGLDAGWLFYEVAMTPFEVFSLSGTGLVTSPLSANDVIGLDVVAIGNDGVSPAPGPSNSLGYLGTKSENMMLDKYMYYTRFGLHELAAAPTTYNLTGTVGLDNYSGSFSMLPPATVELRSGGTRTETVLLDSGGHFTIANVGSGTYDVRVKVSHWLATLQTGIVVESSDKTIPTAFSLVNGDCDEDNEVTSSDLSVILAALDSTFDPQADLNGDDTVTVADLAIVLSNMDQKGAL